MEGPIQDVQARMREAFETGAAYPEHAWAYSTDPIQSEILSAPDSVLDSASANRNTSIENVKVALRAVKNCSVAVLLQQVKNELSTLQERENAELARLTGPLTPLKREDALKQVGEALKEFAEQYGINEFPRGVINPAAADRQTACANLWYQFTPEEADAYPDLFVLVCRLRGIHDDPEIDEEAGKACFLRIDFCDSPINRQKEFTEGLLTYGQEFRDATKDRETYVMEPQQCHANAIKLAQEHTHLKAFRGWAVNGFWQPHSWAWDPLTNMIYETTNLDWEHYFGVELLVKAE